ncbi:hypothetical protein PHYSODRAFT_329288 [Phytophthora sojae]|uniref:Transposase MuDR plant domain-containing protein n=1 Tax=Phytophthora sojae (strain P6497) TaxID=1094619 RepID=G4ZBV4_PHYSP|nr:hypothetical protein PHYSODRAFT_329288 [Phytophthora sojae]EGZ21308.1 hypothetical protein PHYSODRAFT_329288 [Phytophthora sojae]|eukprot:XP_009524025.1 hypothetical protein PHYSODRAFT_329288 [Phytophthora sojae]
MELPPPPPPPTSHLAQGPADDTITEGTCFPDQKSCTKALRKYAATHGMTIKLDPKHHGGAMLTYKCDGGDQCRFTVVALRSQRQASSGYFISHCNLAHNMCIGRSKLTASQVRNDELIRSLVASDPSIGGKVIVDHVKRMRGGYLPLSDVQTAVKVATTRETAPRGSARAASARCIVLRQHGNS